MTTMTVAQALNTALRDALQADDRVLVFGEDVGALGGVFRITGGLTKDFGEERCFDTPLAEAGIVGLAVGMAMGGFRPVVEMEFDAFADPLSSRSPPMSPSRAAAPAAGFHCPWSSGSPTPEASAEWSTTATLARRTTRTRPG
jgi:hypothetical protein